MWGREDVMCGGRGWMCVGERNGEVIIIKKVETEMFILVIYMY